MEIDEPDFDEGGPDVAESVGPIQLWSVAFEGNQFRGEILPELERLKREGIVRIIDLLFVRKDSEGAVMVSTQSDLDWAEAVSLGAYLGSLAGYVESGPEGFDTGAIAGAAELADGHFFDSDDIFQLTQALPEGTSAAIALLEHLWAKPLLDAIDRANGTELESRLLRPEQVFTPDKLSRARKPELGGA
jgi:uncharacterized membrane protein